MNLKPFILKKYLLYNLYIGCHENALKLMQIKHINYFLLYMWIIRIWTWNQKTSSMIPLYKEKKNLFLFIKDSLISRISQTSPSIIILIVAILHTIILQTCSFMKLIKLVKIIITSKILKSSHQKSIVICIFNLYFRNISYM
jgi:hypothetical protein